MTVIPTDLDFMTVEELKKTEVGWPLDYVATRGLAPYISRLRGDKHVGVEIGTCRGESAYYLLERCPFIKILYTIDPYTEFEDWVGIIPQETLDRQYEIAKTNLNRFGDRVKMIKKRSDDKEVIDMFEKDSLDFLFVDGDHSLEATRNDLVNYYSKVKRGGLICGHDYGLPSVRSAISEFRKICKCNTPLQMTTNNAWFFTK